MIYRIFSSALVAGFLSALLITGLQALITTPLIIQAESFEISSPADINSTNEDATEEWMPEDGMERTLYSLLANFGAATGFALLLLVGCSFDIASTNGTRGILWGIAGFSVFTLAPSLGLPPGTPAMLVPDHNAAQIWWFITVIFSAAGLATIVFVRSNLLKILGIVLVTLPHIWGAPPVIDGESLVPANLAIAFSTASIVLSAIFWIVIGFLSGLLFERSESKMT